MSPMFLLRLPNELLIYIFEDLDEASLVSIANTCRSLHDLAQSVLFKRQMIHIQALVDSGELVTEGETVRNLLECDSRLVLSGPPGVGLELRIDPNRNLSRTLHSFYGLITRIEHAVDCVTLRLEQRDDQIISTPITQWGQLATVMNAVVERPGSVLTVASQSYVEWHTEGRPYSYTFVSNSSLTGTTIVHRPQAFPTSPNNSIFQQLVSPALRLFQRLKWKLPGASELPARSDHLSIGRAASTVLSTVDQKLQSSAYTLPECSSPRLIGFHIHSPILLYLPLFLWTLHTLNTSLIKTLSFDHQDLTLYDWASILASLTLPHLWELSLGPCVVAFPDLQSFLMRHPTLVVLDLVGGVPIGHLAPYSSEKILPRLQKIMANPQYIAHFLQPVKAFPDLKSITLTSEYNIIRYHYDYSRFDAVLDCIARRDQRVTLRIMFMSEPGLLEWLMGGQSHRVECVQDLEIDTCHRFIFSTSILEAMIKWLKAFPSLLRLSFLNCFPNTENAASNENPSIILDLWKLYPYLQIIVLHSKVFERPNGMTLTPSQRNITSKGFRRILPDHFRPLHH